MMWNLGILAEYKQEEWIEQGMAVKLGNQKCAA